MLKLLREATQMKVSSQLPPFVSTGCARLDPLQPAPAADGCQKYQWQQFLQPSFRFRSVLIITFVDLAQLQAPGRLHHPVPRAWLGDLWFLKEEDARVGRQELGNLRHHQNKNLLPTPWVPDPSAQEELVPPDHRTRAGGRLCRLCL